MKVADINRPPEKCPDCNGESDWDGATSPGGHPIAWCPHCGNRWPADNQKPPSGPPPQTQWAKEEYKKAGLGLIKVTPPEPPLNPQKKWKQWYKKLGHPGWQANAEWRRRKGIVRMDAHGMPLPFRT